MRIAIEHQTTYRFDHPVTHGVTRLRLRPRDCAVQTVLEWDLHLTGGTIESKYEDHNQNLTALVTFDPSVEEIVISCRGTVETRDSAGVVGPHVGFMPLWLFRNPTELTMPGPLVRALAARCTQVQRQEQGGQSQSQGQSQGLSLGSQDNVLAVLHDLSTAVAGAIAYESGYTDAATPAEAALAAGRGVCQDHAQVFIAAARLLGIPARYISGYLLMDAQTAQGAGHAWAEAFVPGLGWVGFDVSNAICPDSRYVRLGVGLDYRDAAPVTSVAAGGGDSRLSVSLNVRQEAMAQ